MLVRLLGTALWTRRSAIAPTVGLILVAFALVLAGCGATAGAGGSGAASVPTKTPVANHPGIPGTGLTVRPCSGPWGHVADIGKPAVVLNDAANNTTVTVHPGDLVQVQLPISWRWSFDGNAGALTLVQPAAAQDAQADVCFWNFRAGATGTTTLHFSGNMVCEPNRACPALARIDTFTVVVA